LLITVTPEPLLHPQQLPPRAEQTTVPGLCSQVAVDHHQHLVELDQILVELMESGHSTVFISPEPGVCLLDMRPSKQLLQSYQVMDFTFDSIVAMKASLTQDGKLKLTREDALAVKALVSAWESAQQRVSFHRRVPSPGVIRRETEPARRATGSRSLGAYRVAIPRGAETAADQVPEP
jgi:hypothetical protein